MKAPERIETARLLLRKPTLEDAEAVFSRYSSDAEVTKYLAWSTHTTIEDTKAFLRFSSAEWEKWPAGPYLIESGTSRRLLGGTGLAFETPTSAATGYVFARDAWGHGYATEALGAIVVVARDLGIHDLYALCHVDNQASVRVLEKCGFVLESTSTHSAEFPNLRAGHSRICLCYSRQLH